MIPLRKIQQGSRVRLGVRLLMALACALALALPGSSESTTGSTYGLMQMNVCLSGLGG